MKEGPRFKYNLTSGFPSINPPHLLFKPLPTQPLAVPSPSRDPSLQEMAKILKRRWFLKRTLGEETGESNLRTDGPLGLPSINPPHLLFNPKHGPFGIPSPVPPSPKFTRQCINPPQESMVHPGPSLATQRMALFVVVVGKKYGGSAEILKLLLSFQRQPSFGAGIPSPVSPYPKFTRQCINPPPELSDPVLPAKGWPFASGSSSEPIDPVDALNIASGEPRKPCNFPWFVVGLWLVCGWFVVGLWLVCGWFVWFVVGLLATRLSTVLSEV